METRLAVPNPWEGAPVFVKERTGTTMDDARELARAGSPSGTVAVAGFQDQGRGRVPGRRWRSAPWESLLATIVVRRTDIRFPVSQLPLRSAIALADAVGELAGIAAKIRWPNDCLFEGMKLAGILCEADPAAALIGVGVNCLQRGFPGELRGAACSLLMACGREIPPLSVLPVLLRKLKESLDDPLWKDRLDGLLWGLGERRRLALIGSPLTVEGIVKGVDEQGALLVETEDGAVARVQQGEVISGR